MSFRAIACLVACFAFVVALSSDAAPTSNAAEWGSVKGTVTLPAGKPIPERPKLNVTNPQCLAKGPVLNEDWVVDANSRGVQNVLVWLIADPPTGKLEIHPDLQKVPANPAVLDQPCCQFEPHVLAMRAGQTLLVKNSAAFPHNALIQGADFTANPLIPAGGKEEFKAIPAAKAPYKVSCSIHPWMGAFIRVFDHPYFAVTDAQGKFEIKDAPAGKCRIVVWQESIGYLGGAAGRNGEPIDIKSGAATTKDFQVAGK